MIANVMVASTMTASRLADKAQGYTCQRMQESGVKPSQMPGLDKLKGTLHISSHRPRDRHVSNARTVSAEEVKHAFHLHMGHVDP